MTIHPAFVLGPVLSQRVDGTSVADFKARLLVLILSWPLALAAMSEVGQGHLEISNWNPCPCSPGIHHV